MEEWKSLSKEIPEKDGIYIIRWPSGIVDMVDKDCIVRYGAIKGAGCDLPLFLWLGPLPELPKEAT